MKTRSHSKNQQKKHERMAQRTQIITLNRDRLTRIHEKRLKEAEEKAIKDKTVYERWHAYVDQQYLDIIMSYIHTEFTFQEALACAKDVFRDGDLITLYKTVIGLSNFFENTLMYLDRSELNILFRTNLLEILKQYMTLSGHPFVQVRAIEMCRTLRKINDNLGMFHKLNISVDVFFNTLKSQALIVVRSGLKLMSQIIRMESFFYLKDCDPLHRQFLCRIKGLMEKDNSDLPLLAYKFLICIPMPLRKERVKLDNQIFDILFTFLVNRREEEVFRHNTRWHPRKKMLDSICNIIQCPELRAQYSKLNKFMSFIIDYEQSSVFFPFERWVQTITHLASKRESVLYRFKIVDRLEQLLVAHQEEQKYVPLLKIYAILVDNFTNADIPTLLHRPTIMAIFGKMYRKADENKTFLLNEAVLLLFMACPYSDMTQYLISNSILISYVSKTLELEPPLALTYIKKLSNKLMALQQSKELDDIFKTLISHIVENGLIQAILQKNTLEF